MQQFSDIPAGLRSELALAIAKDLAQKTALEPTKKPGLWAGFCRFLLVLSPLVAKVGRVIGLPFKVAWMNSRMGWLRLENEYLKLCIRAAAKGLVKQVKVEKGDLLIFVVDNPTANTMGHSFGSGWVALKVLQQELSKLAGGNVGTMASQKNNIDIASLNFKARGQLRATLDAADNGAAVPTFPLETPKGFRLNPQTKRYERVQD